MKRHVYDSGVKLYIILLGALCFLAFVAPIPAHSAAEVYETLSQQRMVERPTIEEGKIIPIGFLYECKEEQRYSILQVLGTAILEKGNLTINLRTHHYTYDDKMLFISKETTDCLVVIPEYNKMQESLSWMRENEFKYDEMSSSVLALQDWGIFNTYYWRGKRFVSLPGNDQTWVKYDHPDNYYLYYPGQWNLDWDMYDSPTKTNMFHISVAKIQEAKLTGAIGAILGAMASVLGVFLVVLAAKILAILALVVISVYAFVTLVVEAEQGDGWAYLCGPGDWPYTNWWWVSFGIWRDLWWIMHFE